MTSRVFSSDDQLSPAVSKRAGFLMRLKRKLASWLVDTLAAEAERRRAPVLAVLRNDAQILAEGTIDNFSGKPENIAIGEHSVIRGRLLVYSNAGSIQIGDWCYVGARTEIWSMAHISIGNRVLISHGVNIIDNTAHSKNPIERHEHFRRIVTYGHPTDSSEIPGVFGAAITIEDDVWISCGVTILQGVRIGARSIIAAGAIVTKDVPPDTLYRNEPTVATRKLDA